MKHYFNSILRFCARFMPALRPAMAKLCCALFCGVTQAAPGDIFNLGTLGGSYRSGWAINNAGQVAAIPIQQRTTLSAPSSTPAHLVRAEPWWT